MITGSRSSCSARRPRAKQRAERALLLLHVPLLYVVKRVKELLENYVKPAVEMDGGAIQFKSYNDGIVNLMLQGSCSGCPSSMVTLKAGIEGMMKRMIPEVKEVVAEAE